MDIADAVQMLGPLLPLLVAQLYILKHCEPAANGAGGVCLSDPPAAAQAEATSLRALFDLTEEQLHAIGAVPLIAGLVPSSNETQDAARSMTKALKSDVRLCCISAFPWRLAMRQHRDASCLNAPLHTCHAHTLALSC